MALTALLAFLASALLLCPAALADADPASDVLLGETVFYPYSPPVSASLQAALNGATAAAHKARFPIKVALIASPVDLGAIPTFFGKPKQYAAFLDQEISFAAGKVPLLVVMPAGYGTAGMPSAAAAAAASLVKPPSGGADALAQAAIAAVRKLAGAAGHPLKGAASGPARTGGGSSVAVPLASLIAVCVAFAALIVVVRRRRGQPAARR